MNVAELIERKRDGQTLEDSEIQWLIRAYTEGRLPDYQMAAMAMAVFFRRLDARELAAWTDAMLHSGEVVDLSGVPMVKVDKHSTGGVGDKVSLALAPLVAACGVAVPMVSGRGLGHTGGTLDKLEAIPGFRVDLGLDHFVEQVGAIGVCMIGQTATLAPADRKLYALRDVTGTVHSQELICASIMSKKLAEGLDALVLDVKVGSGAFMKTLEDARHLAGLMISIGTRLGKRVRALCTDMSQPLGRMVGNALETREAIDLLHGRAPADLTELTLELGVEMLCIAETKLTPAAARARLEQAVRDGSAAECMREMVRRQYGDPAVVDDPVGVMAQARARVDLPAPRAGVVSSIDTLALGWGAVDLGAGRERVDSQIDPAVGMEIHVRRGDTVTAGQPLLTVHYNDSARLQRAMARLQGAFVLGDEALGAQPPLVLDRLGTA